MTRGGPCDRDACEEHGGCNLKRCHREHLEDGRVACEFAVNLDGQTQYTLLLIGLSDASDKNADISITFKPPSSCVYMKGCENPLDTSGCKIMRQRDMPWLTVKKGMFPAIRCVEPVHAEAFGFTTETKPFCLAPGLYHDVESCWPVPTSAVGGGEAVPSIAGVGAGGRGRYAPLARSFASLDWYRRGD